MDLIETIGDTITVKGKEAADKAKEMADIIHMKGQIKICEDIVRKNYLEIGKIYYEQYGDMPEAPFEKQCRAITNARKGVEDLQERINERRGLV